MVNLSFNEIASVSSHQSGTMFNLERSFERDVIIARHCFVTSNPLNRRLHSARVANINHPYALSGNNAKLEIMLGQ
ncbi:hypothetical protein CBM2629_B90091 [Cupriavidus taiwanensis]|nr:hypothetical protein CBM2629_B90091 [Cupriavidus taiwanensis]